MPKLIPDDKILKTIQEFRNERFNTLQFANIFKRKFTADWEFLVNRYGKGGRGNGSNYSPYVYFGKAIARFEPFKYVPAPKGWGSPVIALFGTGRTISIIGSTTEDYMKATQSSHSSIISCPICSHQFKKKEIRDHIIRIHGFKDQECETQQRFLIRITAEHKTRLRKEMKIREPQGYTNKSKYSSQDIFDRFKRLPGPGFSKQ